jgi:phosphoribosylformylglycinamidine cyclo-ligase
MKKKPSTYKDAGVDIDAGNEAVELIKERTAKVFPLIRTGRVISNLGGFGAVVELEDGRIIVATTDGVGTKLIIAILLDRHDTVGIDLCAMCYNDLIAVGVLPLFFLDYIAQGKQIPAKTAKIINGILDGCEQARSPLIGGEMAECPGLYNLEEYDLAGFSIGLADSRKDLILGDGVQVDMYAYGLLSSGLHSNGYSLVRNIFDIDINAPVASIKRLNHYINSLGCTLGEELLKPTTIYVDVVEGLMKKYTIAGMANVTGGGLVENPPRILPDGCGMNINLKAWEPQPIFKLIQEKGNVERIEMLQSTNYGIGFLVISPDEIQEEGVVKSER